jgi:hypothetical protein
MEIADQAHHGCENAAELVRVEALERNRFHARHRGAGNGPG